MRTTSTTGISLARLAPALAFVLLGATAMYVLLSPNPQADTAPAEAATAAPAAPTAAAAGAPSGVAERFAVARRGTLTEVLTLSGRIGATQEVPLSFQSAQRVSLIHVNVGDAVTAGQVLAEADQRELARSLANARERLSTAQGKLDQAEALGANKARVTEQRQTAIRVRAERAVAEAEAGVRRSETQYERVRAGATPAERRAAEIAEVSARASLARAEADLVKLRQGPDDLEIRQAEQQVAVAQSAMQKALAESQRLALGADQAQLRAAERDVLNAQNGVMRAQLDLEKLTQPDPVALAAAQREVQRTQMALRLAEQNSRSSSSSDTAVRTSQAERRAAIENARLALQDAQDRYERLRAGPPPGEISVAQRNLVVSRSVLDNARERLDLARLGPDQPTLEQARIAVDSTRLAYESALARLTTLRAGPTADQVTVTVAAYETAQASLRSAQALQAELLARPTQAELTEASEQITAARSALEQASAEAQVMIDSPVDDAANEIEPLRQAVIQERVAVQALEGDLMNAQLVAPFDGVVINVNARPDQGVDASRPVVTLAARDAQPTVVADVPTTDGTRVAVGQRVTVTYSGTSTSEVAATVSEIADAGVGQTRILARASWAETPRFGAPASIAVVTRERTNVVIVPERALGGSGPRRTLQVVEGESRRIVQVDVGLITGGEAEILNGIEPETRVITT